jgi:hypothetical protein
MAINIFHFYQNKAIPFLLCLGFFSVRSEVAGDSLSSCSPARVYAYLQVSGKNIDTVYRTVSVSGNETVITYSDPPNIRSNMICGETLNVLSWSHENKKTGYDITIKRSRDTLIKTGLKGEKTIRSFQIIDSMPWYQSMEFSLVPFLRRGGSACAFWIVRPSDMNAFKMVAQRKDVETIQVHGHSEKAVKVTLSPKGLVGRLWKAVLWYSASDYSFFKSSLPGLIPGSSGLTVESLEPAPPQ